jgi:hypothetical protein
MEALNLKMSKNIFLKFCDLHGVFWSFFSEQSWVCRKQTQVFMQAGINQLGE